MDGQRDLFSIDIQYVKGVGPKRAELFSKLGIDSVGALLQFYPRAYIDLQQTLPLSQAPFDAPCAVLGRVVRKLPPARLGGGKTLYKLLATDFTQDFAVVFWQNRFPYESLKEGQDYLFYGKFGGTLTQREVNSPLFLPEGERRDLLPVYPLTKGLTSKAVATAVENALAAYGEEIPDPLPAPVQADYQLCRAGYAVKNIHRPETAQAAQTARRRLIFEELLVLQLGLGSLKKKGREHTDLQIPAADLGPFLQALPYSLTGAQLRCIGEIGGDMAGAVPMNRLLQGDVGSGKTVVAAAAVYRAAQAGVQSALMAPTEILAAQHHRTLEGLLRPLGLTVALLTGSMKAAEKRAVLAGLQDGSTDLVVGTHALLGDAVSFAELGLVITDEQHRFGVNQRGALGDKGRAPHVLVMSATPIPRTLALIIYGDLDISVLDEKPAGRREIETFAVGYGRYQRALNFAEKQIAAGHQVYVVCPLIEEGESELESVSAVRDQMAAYLPHRRIGLLHGKMKAREKEAVMAAFSAGELDALCSTTVVEVGVDVPNANLMMIHNADRFGLSALHQLRGRVGRSDCQSYCILLSKSGGEGARKRLQAMCESSDGFALANLDLEMRGPGDFFGAAQHGLPQLKIADLLTDRTTLAETSAVARQLLEEDVTLRRWPLLRQAVGRLFSSISENGFN